MANTTRKPTSPWGLGKHTGLMLALSCVINLLGLVGAIYMMQVYDRVLSSGSVPTLVGISIIALMLYAFYGFLEYFRTEFCG
jgi:ATP-binding cassette subfamily C protein